MAPNLLTCTFGKVKIPQRYVMVFIVCLGILNAFHLRVVLNIAMGEMRYPSNHTKKEQACPQFKREDVVVKEGKYKWSNNVEAMILYAFYIGYMCSQVPGGWLADKIGARWVMSGCLLTATILNILYPISVSLWDYHGAIIVRIMIGLAEGPLLPTAATFIQCWIPAEERSFLGSIIWSGQNLGTVTGSVLTGVMIRATNSWAVPFYVWGVVSLVWLSCFLIWVFSRPETHPFITEEELNYLRMKVEQRKQFKVPWIDLFKSGPIWALLMGQLGHNLLFFTLFTNLPKYMKEILCMDVARGSLFYSIPFVLLWILCIVFGFVATRLERRVSLSVIRRSFTFGACFVPSVLLISVPYIGCHRTVVVIFNTLAIGFIAPFFSGMKINVNDITTHYGGIIMAFVNGLGALSGIVGPFIVGVLTGDETLAEWKLVFWILGAVSVGLTVLYVIFTETDRQYWDYVDDSSRRPSFN